MRRLIRLLSLGAVFAVTACRGSQAPVQQAVVPTPAPYYSLCVEASPRLNWYDQSAHTLFIRVFQLSSLEAFIQADVGNLLDPQTTLAGLEGTPIEKTIYPASRISIDVPVRPEADFIGTVAGYYRADGSTRAHRQLRRTGIAEPCMKLGPNAIEAP